MKSAAALSRELRRVRARRRRTKPNDQNNDRLYLYGAEVALEYALSKPGSRRFAAPTSSSTRLRPWFAEPENYHAK